jgi:DNA-directed RNA polymerase sigma subunit (sigma70/sigma32)
MKTSFKTINRAGIKSHRLQRVRLTPSRRSCPQRSTILALESVAAKPLPEIVRVESETVPTESLHGDPLQLYSREIGQVKLLTPQEEITLAWRIRRGHKKAREQMITANLRLVVRLRGTTKGLACRCWISSMKATSDC